MEVIRQRPDQKFQYRSLDIGGDYEQVSRVLSEIEDSFGPSCHMGSAAQEILAVFYLAFHLSSEVVS